MSTDFEARASAVQVQEFGDVFRITGNTVEGVSGVRAPEVYNDDETDIMICGDGWTALRGITGQWGYNGPIMHSSEFVGSSVARAMVESAGRESVFALVIVECVDDDGAPAGWAIVRLNA